MRSYEEIDLLVKSLSLLIVILILVNMVNKKQKK